MFRQKKVISILCALIMVSAFFLVPSFRTNAADNEMISYQNFYVSYPEPSANENQGYVNILLRDKGDDGVFSGDDNYFVRTYFWYTCGTYSGGEMPSYACLIFDTSADTFTFTVGGNTALTGAKIYYSLTQIGDTGTYWNLQRSSSASYTLNFGEQGLDMVAVKFKGNVGESSGVVSGTSFTMHYGGDSSARLLMDIYAALNSMSLTDNQIYNRVDQIVNSTDSIDDKLQTISEMLDTNLSQILQSMQTIEQKMVWIEHVYDRLYTILEEQKKSNTWLEKIFNYLNESQEQQKQEAQTQGSSSVSQGNSAIEDKGAGFSDSLGGLVSSMSYNGTECAWNFPEVRLPAIPGVMDEVVLIKSQPIDFGMWVNAIPSGILLVVQSICTMALIVYCFKELYDTISYVLTLRRSSDS